MMIDRDKNGKFIKGHCGWNKGLKYSCTKTKGQKFSKEHCKNISIAMKGKPSWTKGLTNETDERIRKRSILVGLALKGKKQPKISKAMKGRKFSKEHCKNLSKSMKGRIPWNKGKKMSKEIKVKISKSVKLTLAEPEIQQKIIIGKANLWKNGYIIKIELKLQNELKKNNISFEIQKPIRGIPDIFITPNICIFCDGDYWHGNPKFYKNLNTHQKYKRRTDYWVTKELKKQSYRVLRFWEHDINNNIEKCIFKIVKISALNPSQISSLKGEMNKNIKN